MLDSPPMAIRIIVLRRVAILCIAALLYVQLSGLHQHRHIDWQADDSHGRHAVQLHFGDAGLHGDELGPAHSHAAGETAHAHLDVDIDAVGDALAKLLSILLFVVLASGVLQLRRPGRATSVLRPPRESPIPKRSRFSLRPPSQAPPLLLITA